MTQQFTPIERRILTRIQWKFPLHGDPYGVLAAEMGCARDEVLDGVRRMRESGVIRRIGGSFVPARLGYVSVLAAACVEPPRLESVAALAASFPEVTHNYEREDRLNLWFTVIAESSERLQGILQMVGNCGGVHEIHGLPALKTFKIRVNFDLQGDAEGGDERGSHHAGAPAVRCGPSDTATSSRPYPVDDIDRHIIPRFCGDIGDSERPYAAIAEEIGISEAELLSRLSAYRESGVLRRFGAILRHQRAGFSANGMSVWDVPERDVLRVGGLMAEVPEISHCYERPRFSGWPYNLFGMIHANSRDRCLELAADLSRIIGIGDYRVLFSVREFKKTSMVYKLDGKD